MSKKGDGKSGEQPERELPQGVKLLHTLRGHTGEIRRIAWSPDGTMLASPSSDQTIRIWDARAGEQVRVLTGHKGSVYCVAWSSDGSVIASGSKDNRILLWDVNTGSNINVLHKHRDWVNALAWHPSELLASGAEDAMVLIWDTEKGTLKHSLEGHHGNINALAWSPDSRTLASASGDHTIILWDADSGSISHVLSGHKDWVFSLAWHPDGNTLISASWDKTIRKWNAQTGQQLHVLEEHTRRLSSASLSYDGRFLATKSSDDTVRLWRCDTWGLVASIDEPRSQRNSPSIAFHPKAARLATLGERDTVIRIWELNPTTLLSATTPQKPVFHITAKIVLVGDHSVGKSGLGWRLVHGEFKEQASTHGQQFWVLPQLGKLRNDGTQCEAILWDLAGQPDYRLIHALFLDDVDLALVLFDSSDISGSLHGVEFWLKQLKCGQASTIGQSGGSCRTILVGAQADRGTPALTLEELETFCRQRDISGYVSTSAKEGRGLEELVRRMKELIPWEDKPATVTTVTFKRIKDYVLKLKENPRRKKMLVSPPELRKRLEQTDGDWRFTDAEMLTAAGYLENYGYVKRLRTSKGEERILLAPELLNNLAASFVLEARRNEKGLGSLEEKRLLAGEYSFPELEKLALSERDILLDSAALLFLEHNICFRETDPLSARSYVVFPELINLKKPASEDEKPTEDGMAYTVTGAVENVYASLVVLLGYTQTFTRTNQWHNQARYEVGNGLICGFRQDGERDGNLDFVLYFGTDVVKPVRTLFQGLFESFLGRRNLTVFRYEPVLCTRCGQPLDRSVVRSKSREGKTFTFCNDCGEKLALPKLHEPIQLTQQQKTEVERQRRVADLRTQFEQAIFRVQAYVNDQRIRVPECFFSYAWGNPEHERWVEKNLATDLQKAGIKVLLDRWENSRVGSSIMRFVERIEECDYLIVVGTPLYRQKAKNVVSEKGSVVAAEWDLAGIRLLATEAHKGTVLPVLLAGAEAEAFPALLRGRVFADFRNESAYFFTAFDLILDVYGISHTDTAVADLRESLSKLEMR